MWRLQSSRPATSSGTTPTCVGAVTRELEGLRGFAEHRARLHLVALRLTKDPSRLPHRTDPRTCLPHT
jgi:hypothetical protein